MNNDIIDDFEAKLITIIRTGGLNGDGKISIAAEDLLNSIRLYKTQLSTIEFLQRKVEILEKSDTGLHNVIAWQKRAEKFEYEKDQTIIDYNELYRLYSQIVNESIMIKRKSNNLIAENTVLKESLWAIAVAETENVDLLKEYAGATLESLVVTKTE